MQNEARSSPPFLKVLAKCLLAVSIPLSSCLLLALNFGMGVVVVFITTHVASQLVSSAVAITRRQQMQLPVDLAIWVVSAVLDGTVSVPR